jgi:hypothetical protein
MRNILLIGLIALMFSCGNTNNKPNYKATLSKLIEGKNITKVDVPSDASRECKSVELTDDGIITVRYTGNNVIEEVELSRDKESNEYKLNISVIKHYDKNY